MTNKMSPQEVLETLRADDTITATSEIAADYIKAIAEKAGIEIYEAVEYSPNRTYVIWAI